MLLSAPQALYQCQNSDRELKLKSSDTEKNLSAQKKKVRVKRLARRKSKPEVGAYKVPHLFICFVRLNKLIMITMITSSWSKKYNSFPISSLNNDDNCYFLVYLFIALGASSMGGWSDQIVTSELQFSWQSWQKSCETVWSHNYAPI